MMILKNKMILMMLGLLLGAGSAVAAVMFFGDNLGITGKPGETKIQYVEKAKYGIMLPRREGSGDRPVLAVSATGLVHRAKFFLLRIRHLCELSAKPQLALFPAWPPALVGRTMTNRESDPSRSSPSARRAGVFRLARPLFPQPTQSQTAINP